MKQALTTNPVWMRLTYYNALLLYLPTYLPTYVYFVLVFIVLLAKRKQKEKEEEEKKMYHLPNKI